jgi:hypothetical protein
MYLSDGSPNGVVTDSSLYGLNQVWMGKKSTNKKNGWIPEYDMYHPTLAANFSTASGAKCFRRWFPCPNLLLLGSGALQYGSLIFFGSDRDHIELL